VIIRHFVESPSPPQGLTVMVQKEVAERMTAISGEMSLLGIATQLYTEAEIAFVVPPESFLPPPKVESAVVTMRVRDELPVDQPTRDRLFELATIAFQRKRKTLANGLANGLDRPKSDVEELLGATGIDPMRRPQTLDVDEWIAVATVFAA
jgi:16S rRNA (adenine1518-N6/adenine1519-N6)-dimethyltransferase